MPDEPRPEFPVVRRGYDRDWVDTYIDRVTGELARLAAENRELRRDDARSEREALDADVDALRVRRVELTDEIAELEQHVNDLRTALGRLLSTARKVAPHPAPPAARGST
jgi:DivIVA domain-containing protein